MSLSVIASLGGIYLSSDGTASGELCDLDIVNLPDLKTKYWGNSARNARGNPESNISPVAGVELTLTMPGLSVAVFDALVALFDGSFDTDTDFELTITGEAGDYTLRAEPNPNQTVSWKDIVEGFFTEVSIRIITKVEE